MKAHCKLHGLNKSHLFIPCIGSKKVCRDCIAEGMYKKTVLAQAKEQYPEKFTEEEIKSVGVSHTLKLLPEFFEEVLNGNKNFEIRKNDRGFHKGDRLVLKEWVNGKYTERGIIADVTLVVDYEQKDGYVVMGIRPRQVVSQYYRTVSVELKMKGLSPAHCSDIHDLVNHLSGHCCELVSLKTEAEN